MAATSRNSEDSRPLISDRIRLAVWEHVWMHPKHDWIVKSNDNGRAYSSMRSIYRMQNTRYWYATKTYRFLLMVSIVAILAYTAWVTASIPLGIVTGVLVAGAILGRVLDQVGRLQEKRKGVDTSKDHTGTRGLLSRIGYGLSRFSEIALGGMLIGELILPLLGGMSSVSVLGMPLGQVGFLAVAGIALGCGVLTYLALYCCDRSKIREANKVIDEFLKKSESGKQRSAKGELTSPVPSLSLRQETGAPAAVSGKVSDAEPSLGLGAALLSTT